MELAIRAWSAWTLDSSTSVDMNDKRTLPDVSWVPANMRRRLSSFTKMALFAAYNHESLSETIFATRHGDLAKTLQQLHNLVQDEPLSPTQFALSVHNAVSGQYAIATGNQCASTTLSAGINTFDMALLAAFARLTAQPQLSHVLLVVTDETVPEIYQGYGVDAEPSAALALRISLPSEEQSEHTVQFRAETTNSNAIMHSNLYQILGFLQENRTDLEYENAGYNWRWQRHQLEISP